MQEIGFWLRIVFPRKQGVKLKTGHENPTLELGVFFNDIFKTRRAEIEKNKSVYIIREFTCRIEEFIIFFFSENFCDLAGVWTPFDDDECKNTNLRYFQSPSRKQHKTQDSYLPNQNVPSEQIYIVVVWKWHLNETFFIEKSVESGNFKHKRLINFFNWILLTKKLTSPFQNRGTGSHISSQITNYL